MDAGIPDFRSKNGLFHHASVGGQQLAFDKHSFDYSMLNVRSALSGVIKGSMIEKQTPTEMAKLCEAVALLSIKCAAATPTAIHKLLQVLAQESRLLRVYTQNIDGLEEKCGISVAHLVC